ncbi:DUF58 domain-containing protein [Haloarcula onubensis]|uniref:DUF58 domain-containing protein n=1 Tax=Haloarcula onubensis TaxID=2950539 RepID=A0ABU2FJR1_9EURY|nr:DUF58 domain-containing protein [Halomicroarcula sp. S3CR25-11]MDS0280995.1 DUF58 domain-containing protein [Halomicroarcula sp. S3CR25-11]
MSLHRRFALALGSLAVLVGALGVATGGFDAAARPGLVIFVGILGVGLALYSLSRRVRVPTAVAVLDDPSDRDIAPPAPSTDGGGSARLTRHRRLADEVRTLLRRAVARDGLDDATADEVIGSGAWTDDPVAAAAFADDVGRSRQLRDWLRARRDGTTTLGYRLDRAGAAIRELLGLPATDAEPSQARTPTGTGVVETGRWAGFRAVPLAFVGVGIVARRPGLLLAGAVAVVALAVGVASRPPDPDLTVTRAIHAEEPAHGDAVTVRMQVRNDGDRALVDCRVADGVPDALAVTDGSPQLATALRPDATATVEYTVRATRGEHRFDAPRVVAGDAAGASARVTEPAVTGDESLSVSLPSADLDVPVRSQTTRLRGRIEADDGGEGIAFYATRDYRPGDPLSRVDWNRYASTRELSTLQFQQEQSATVVVLVDARPDAYHAPADPTLDTTVDRAVLSARGVLDARLDADDRVGLAALSTDRLYVPPSGGQAHRSRLETVLATNAAVGPTPAVGEWFPEATFRWLRRELPSAAQVVCCSPLTDDDVVRVLRYLAAYGHAVTVLSPDPGTRPTAAGTVAAARRQFRCSSLRRQGIPVVDWRHEESLAVAIERQRGEWFS